MPLLLNLRQLELQTIELQGELSLKELDIEDLDDLVRPDSPLSYALEAAHHEQGILLQGVLELAVQCECARCLTPFARRIRLDPWVSLLPWEGEEAVAVRGDLVDLTPYLREDMVLALPQRPLCKPDCGGLPVGPTSSAGLPDAAKPWSGTPLAWQALDKLGF
jgi:uncharacterized protein